MTDLYTLLADQGIRLRRLDPAHTEHINCHRCGGGTHREKGSLSVSIDADGLGATWVCHRGTCNWTGGVHVPGAETRRPGPKPISKTRDHLTEPTLSRPEWFWEFWAERGIGQRTLDQFGVSACEWLFPQLSGNRPHPAIRFPYVHNGVVVGQKFRPYPEKSPQGQQNVGPPVLYNADSLKGADIAIFVEGEPDALVHYEAGVQAVWPTEKVAVVSFKDGAGKEARFDPHDKRFAALATHAEELAAIKRYVMAGDTDGPGLALREETARRLGRHKVWLVNWPKGCKDAGDVLTLRDEEGNRIGVDAILAAYDDMVPYPMTGIRDIAPGTLDKLFAAPPPAIMTTGVRSADAVIRLPADGRLIVLTGTPSHGKSTWLRSVAMHTMQQHQRRWLVFTAEEDVDLVLIDCAQVITGARFRNQMTADERQRAEALLVPGFRLLEVDAGREAPTLDYILERAAFSVLRDNTTDLLIDPYNELEHHRGEATETEYIGRFLQRCKAFAREYRCNVWIIAHPAKPLPPRGNEKRKPPDGYAISGSANWANKCDLGLTVFVPKPGEVEVHVWKSRSRLWGVTGTSARLDFDQATGRYLDPTAKPPNQPDEPAPPWIKEDD